MFTRLNKVYHEFPQRFWIVVGTSFIEGIGNTLLFPFFALYITQKFHIGMTQAGVLLGLSSLAGLFGGILGGALTDKFGRRSIILFGLVFSALSSLAFGFTNSLALMYPLSIIIGLIGSLSHPAHGAIVADIMPEEKRHIALRWRFWPSNFYKTRIWLPAWKRSNSTPYNFMKNTTSKAATAWSLPFR